MNPTANARVMVVENERIVAFNLQQRLTRLGYRVTGIAASGADALNQIRLTSPDLVLMDIRIDGDIDGIETASHLAKTNPVPVIYLTAHAEQSTLDRARATRPYGYLIKPFSEMELHATVQMALERIAVDAELRASEARFRQALDVMMEGCQIIDFDWRYRYVNDSMLQQCRRSRDELLGRTLMDVYPEVETTEIFSVLRHCMKTRVAHDFQQRFEFRDGGVSWFDLSIQPVPEGVFILSIDITSEKLANERLRQFNEQLEIRVAERTTLLDTANKELEAFSYTVAHDLRAPLRHINGFAQLAMDCSLSANCKAPEYIAKMVKSSTKMGRLIDDLLALSRASRAELKSEAVDLDMVVVAVREECLNDADHPEIDWRVDHLPEVQGDAALLHQVFVNLIGNAIKFSRYRDHAVIEIRPQPRDDGWVEISVRDNGAGFDMRHADKLFGVFQRLHHESEFEGTGIGLAIVRNLVERHGGKIKAESEPDSGAVFYFTLPLAVSGGK
ncbi:MAG: ATP-binding protein [Usitatibacteraceae bacterium]